MSQARLEILRLVSQGKITPEEGDRLLHALEESPRESQGASDPQNDPDGQGAWDRENERESEQTRESRRWAEGVYSVIQEVADSAGRVAREAVGAAHRVFEEAAPGSETVATSNGEFEIATGSRLRLQHALRVSLGGGSRGGGLTVRRATTDRVRILRGEAVEVHRRNDEFVLTWAKGPLELEVPQQVASLDVRCLGGDIDIRDFAGTMTLETMGGGLNVHAPRAPLRIRAMGGIVQVSDFGVREGSSSIHTTGGNVRVGLAPESSLRVRVSALGGEISFPAGVSQATVQGTASKKAEWVVGDGVAELRVQTLGGNVRVTHEPAA